LLSLQKVRAYEASDCITTLLAQSRLAIRPLYKKIPHNSHLSFPLLLSLLRQQYHHAILRHCRYLSRSRRSGHPNLGPRL
jgi:hypothetical protein